MGNAFLGMQEMFDPGGKHVIEAKYEVRNVKRQIPETLLPL